jgi:hypothetical protein
METFNELETKQEVEDLSRDVAAVFANTTVPGVHECQSAGRYVLNVWQYVRPLYGLIELHVASWTTNRTMRFNDSRIPAPQALS